MAEKCLHIGQRLARSKQPGRESAPAAMTGCIEEACGAIQPLDVRLKAVGGQVFDNLAGRIPRPLGVEFVGATFSYTN